MAIRVRAGGQWRTPTEYMVRMNGAWGTARGIYVRQNNQWIELFRKNIRAEPGTVSGDVATYTKYADFIRLYTSGVGVLSTMVLNDKVDLTNVKTVRCRIRSSRTHEYSNDIIISVSNSIQGSTGNAVVYVNTPNQYSNWTYLSLNVSNVTGWYYIRVHASVNPGGYATMTRVVDVNEIKLVLNDNTEVVIWDATMV